jgi:hypothetical protein
VADLETALLNALLGFARDRVEKLVDAIAPTPQTLLASMLGYAPTAAQLSQLTTRTAEVQGHLTQAAARAVGAV